MSEKSEEKNELERKDTIVVACDFCENLFDMDRAEYEVAMQQLYDILCAECTRGLEHAGATVKR